MDLSRRAGTSKPPREEAGRVAPGRLAVEFWGPKTYLVLCACGFGRRTTSALGADNTAAWHREDGCEGADHVMFVGYDQPKRRS